MKTWIIWGGLCVMAYITYTVWFPPVMTQADQDRQVIEICWQDYEKKSLDPATKRFIAGTCETLEANFVKNYNRKP